MEDRKRVEGKKEEIDATLKMLRRIKKQMWSAIAGEMGGLGAILVIAGATSFLPNFIFWTGIALLLGSISLIIWIWWH